MFRNLVIFVIIFSYTPFAFATTSSKYSFKFYGFDKNNKYAIYTNYLDTDASSNPDIRFFVHDLDKNKIIKSFYDSGQNLSKKPIQNETSRFNDDLKLFGTKYRIMKNVYDYINTTDIKLQYENNWLYSSVKENKNKTSKSYTVLNRRLKIKNITLSVSNSIPVISFLNDKSSKVAIEAAFLAPSKELNFLAQHTEYSIETLYIEEQTRKIVFILAKKVFFDGESLNRYLVSGKY